MAMRVREIKGKLVALCAAKTEAREGDLYLDDSVDHAIRRKLQADFIREGLVPPIREWGIRLMIRKYGRGEA